MFCGWFPASKFAVMCVLTQAKVAINISSHFPFLSFQHNILFAWTKKGGAGTGMSFFRVADVQCPSSLKDEVFFLFLSSLSLHLPLLVSPSSIFQHLAFVEGCVDSCGHFFSVLVVFVGEPVNRGTFANQQKENGVQSYVYCKSDRQ